MATAINSYASAISSYTDDSNANISLNDIAECMLATMDDAAILSKIHISKSKTDPGSVSQHCQYLGRA